MIRRFLDFLADPDASRDEVGRPGGDERQLAAVALLIEAALMDDRFEESERAKITEIVRSRFELEAQEAQRLIALAEDQVEGSNQLFSFTRVINRDYSQDERVELMEMLWEVAYADGVLHDYEANLMRRIAGLIHVADRDSGAARKRALDRLGLAD